MADQECADLCLAEDNRSGGDCHYVNVQHYLASSGGQNCYAVRPEKGSKYCARYDYDCDYTVCEDDEWTDYKPVMILQIVD